MVWRKLLLEDVWSSFQMTFSCQALTETASSNLKQRWRMCCNWQTEAAPVVHCLLLSPISRWRGSCAPEESEICCMGHSQLVSAPMEDAGANRNVKQPQGASSWPKVKSRICEHKWGLQHFVIGCTAWSENIPQSHSWVWHKYNQIIKVLLTEKRKSHLHSGTHTSNCTLKIWEKYQNKYYFPTKTCSLLLSD